MGRKPASRPIRRAPLDLSELPAQTFLQPPTPQVRAQVQAALLEWFLRARREMPWRQHRTPYRVWVSETMLQQTQVSTVIPYFLRFMERFPDVQALAEAPLEDLLSQWRGLGYYARARNLQRGAQHLMSRHDGQVPDRIEALLEVPGIGRYTAGAILSLAYRQPISVLDGNVARVFSRLFGFNQDVKSPAGQRVLWAIADEFVSEHEPGNFNESLMELGATVCTPTSPSCFGCPIREFCHAATLPNPATFPVRTPTRSRPEVRALAVLIEGSDGDILFGLRPPHGLLAGLWELPTIRWPEGMPLEQAIQRAGERRLLRALDPVGIPVRVAHLFTHLALDLHVVQVRSRGAPIQLAPSAGVPLPVPAGVREHGTSRSSSAPGSQLEVQYLMLRWISPEDRRTLPMGRATLKALERLNASGEQKSDRAGSRQKLS